MQVRATFVWNPTPDADGYEIQMGSTDPWSVSGTSDERELDLEYGEHEFSIRAFNASGFGPSSSIIRSLSEPIPDPLPDPIPDPVPVPGPVEGFDVSLLLLPSSGNHDFTGFPLTPDGFTDFTAMYQAAGDYSDSRIVFLADDGNDGTATNYNAGDAELGGDPFSVTGGVNPYLTPATAQAQLRDGFPDVLLIKRGSVFTAKFDRWDLSGRSATERVIVAAYGASGDLPRFDITSGIMLSTVGGSGSPTTVGNFIWSGIRGYWTSKDPGHASFVDGQGTTPLINVYRAGSNILLEDIWCEWGQLNINCLDGNGFITNICVRRSAVVDNYSTNSHAQGLYQRNVYGWLIEECFFDHNGWNETATNSQKTIFNHNMYLQYYSDNNGEVRRCITARASSHGLQQRCGGTMHDNLFIDNSLAGFISDTRAGTVSDFSAEMSYNVVIGGADIAALPRGWGLNTQNKGYTNLHHNLVVHKNAGVNDHYAFSINNSNDPVSGGQSVDFDFNACFGWDGEALTITGSDANYSTVNVRSNKLYSKGDFVIERSAAVDTGIFTFTSNEYNSDQASDSWFEDTGSKDLAAWAAATGDDGTDGLSFTDDTRTIETYMTSLGQTATVAAFLAKCRLQTRFTWDANYSANTVNEYLRIGYDVGAVP